MGVIKKAIKPMFNKNKWNILRGDTVKVLGGKDRGQVGTVLKVIRDVRVPRVVVEGMNLNKRHTKGQGDNPGGIFSVEGPIHYSKVALVDPVTKAAVRVSRQYLEDGTKVRVTRGKLASGSIVPRPDILLQRRKPRPLAGPKDTAREIVEQMTYDPSQPQGFSKGSRNYSASATENLSWDPLKAGKAGIWSAQHTRRRCLFGFATQSLL